MEKDKSQGEHYNRIAQAYEAHYGDRTSQDYRRRFLYDPLLAGAEIAGWRVLDAMCAGGEVTGYFLDKGARKVVGLDLSKVQIGRYRQRWPACEGICASILATPFRDGGFDAVVVIGGLHHAQAQAEQAVAEIHRLLRPGGLFLFFEPHRGSFPDWVRRVWYRWDPYFLPDEAALDIGMLRLRFADRFEFQWECYVGNLAYLLVLNSLIFRIPVSWKRLYAPFLLALEGPLSRLQTPRTSCGFLARWIRRASP